MQVFNVAQQWGVCTFTSWRPTQLKYSAVAYEARCVCESHQLGGSTATLQWQTAHPFHALNGCDVVWLSCLETHKKALLNKETEAYCARRRWREEYHGVNRPWGPHCLSQGVTVGFLWSWVDWVFYLDHYGPIRRSQLKNRLRKCPFLWNPVDSIFRLE